MSLESIAERSQFKSPVPSFEKELATRLGIPGVQLDVVVNAMVGDEKDPPVSTITLQLTSEQLHDALETVQSQHGVKSQ